MKRIILAGVFLLTLCATSFSYEMSITGLVPIQDSLDALSVNPATGKGVALGIASKTLYIIDVSSATVLHKVSLDTAQTGVAVDVGRDAALVSLTGGTLAIVDLETGNVTEKINVGNEIKSVSVYQGSNNCILSTDDSLVVFSISSGSVISEIAVSGKILKAIEEDGKAVVLHEESPQMRLTLFELPSGKIVGDVPIQDGAIDFAMTGSNNIAVLQRDKLLEFGGDLHIIEEIKLQGEPGAFAINRSTGAAVITNPLINNISVIDLEKKIFLETLALQNPNLVAIDSSRNIVLVSEKDGIAIIKLENPVPVIRSIVPESTSAGSPGLQLSIGGSKFIRDSKAHFNLKDLTTLFEDNSLLKALVPAEELLIPGYIPVTVSNPEPGGGISNSLAFGILNAVPQIDSITPDAVALTGLNTDVIRLKGKNFLPSSVISLNGKNLETRFISSIVLEASLDLAGIKVPAKYPVTVTNPAPASFTSNVVFLDVAENESMLGGKGRPDMQKESTNPATGTLTGRILNTNKDPIEGVTIQIKGFKTVTNSDGGFTLRDVPSGKQLLMVHGETVQNPNSHYPTIPLTINIEANKINEMPFQIYLHRQKNYNFVDINPSEDTVLTDPEVPGFEMRIPKGVKITGWDGQPNQKVSVRPVPIDRLPVKPLPDNAFARTVYMFYFSKIGGGKADRPIPIKAPNDLGLLPGEKAVLWYYDESPNEGEAPNDWAIAGTGTVTSDGRYIVTDPGVGIPKFCCGASTFGGTPLGSPPSGPSDDSCRRNNVAGDPVNLLTGYFMHEKIDYRVPGIIPVEITRTYRSGDQGSGNFGRGTFFGYDWWLNITSNLLTLLMPGNYQYKFSKQPDGTFIDTADPAYIGDVITQNTDGTYTLKRKNGWSYTFDPNLLKTIKDPNGNTLSIYKEIDGNISRIVMPDGTQVNINYNIGPRDSVSSINGPWGTVTYTYGGGGLQSVQYPDGSAISYTYDSSGRMATITENGNLVVTNQYDSNDRVTQQTHSDGGTYTFNYTIAGGNITQTSMTAPNGGMTTWRFYDDSGNYRGGYIVKKTTSDGTTTYNRQAGTNLLQSVADPLGMTTSYTYDTAGRVTAVTDPTGKATSYQYETTCSRVTQITDALSDITKMTYDSKCNLLTITTPLSEVTTLTYNSLGLPITIKDPLNNTTTMAYDSSGNLTTITDPLGNVNTMTYDSLQRLSSYTDASGKSTNYDYDLAGRITQVQDALGNITRYYYSQSGKLILFFDAKGNGITYNYDNRDRVVKMTDQLGRYETYAYDTSDNIISFTDRKNQATTYTYDQMNRVTKASYADGSSTTYTYDADGRVTNIADSISGTIQYVYETAGCRSCGGGLGDRILQETTPLGSISYTYDNIGRRTGMTLSGQPQVTYTYDNDSRLTSVATKIGNSARTYSLAYDKSSRRTSSQDPLSTKNKYVTTTYSPYDNANRILGMVIQGPSAQIENLVYAYDPNGNRTAYTRTATQPLRTGVTSTSYDNANEMSSFAPATGSVKNMTYDNNGNLLTSTNASGTTNYTWDVRNRLTAISSPGLTVSFGYDAIGRRISKTINGTTTQYVYDGLDIIQEIQGTAKTNYIRTLKIDEPLTRIKADGTVRHYVKDALGNVIALTDDTGAVKTTYTYDPFGNVTVTGEASDNPSQYTGRENDGTGLYYYRARYYSPELQRFISEDPIGLRGGINLFSYTDNNPANFTDPEGKSIWGWFKCGQYVDKYMKARNACMNECAKDELQYYDKYGNGASDFSANMDCVCKKMGYDSSGYAECVKAYKECIMNGVNFPPKPNR